MKKALIILLAALFAMTLIVGCKDEPAETTAKKGYTGKTYALGSTGPGGGIVFYDVDADNATGNADGLKSDDCGWRYLEAASANAYNNNASPTFVFGYYRTSYGNTAVGTSSEFDGDKIGAGKDNTDKLIDVMGKGGCSSSEDGNTTRDYYAASIINLYNDPQNDTQNKFGGKTDWFLPSKEEAIAMVNYLHLDGTYWTSTESTNYGSKQAISVGSGVGDVSKATDYAVRPVRRF